MSTLDKLIEIISHSFTRSDSGAAEMAGKITMETKLIEDLGLDSFDHLELTMSVEEEWGLDVPDEDSEKFLTVGDVVRYIDNEDITEQQFKDALNSRDEAEKVISAYCCQKLGNADKRWDEFMAGTPYTEDELIYSASARCKCGAGIAYPKSVGARRYWICSAVLKADVTKNSKNFFNGDHEEFPFAFYEIKSEGATTRPVNDPTGLSYAESVDI